MSDTNILAISAVVGLTALAFVLQFVLGKNGPIHASWRRQAKELEVQVRMGTAGEKLVQDLRDLAATYAKLGKPWDAEQTLRRAELICIQNWGERSEHLADVLEDFAKLMASINRRGEATSLRKRIKHINENREQ